MAVVNANPYNVMGFISRTVSSNNLTVAIKDRAGSDFSAGNPMVHKIGSAPRSLAGALSVTVNAGTNTFAAGSVFLSGNPIDLFVYLGWRAASSTVFIVISRVPYAKTYADFSATATHEKYGAYSGSAPASTDEVENIGRVNAQNSGTASYNWSIPATSIVVNRPIYETEWLSRNTAALVAGAGGSAGTYAQTSDFAMYKIVGDVVKETLGLKITNVGSWSGDVELLAACTASGGENFAVLNGGAWATGAAPGTLKGQPYPTANSNILVFFATMHATNLQWSGMAANDFIHLRGEYRW